MGNCFHDNNNNNSNPNKRNKNSQRDESNPTHPNKPSQAHSHHDQELKSKNQKTEQKVIENTGWIDYDSISVDTDGNNLGYVSNSHSNLKENRILSQGQHIWKLILLNESPKSQRIIKIGFEGDTHSLMHNLSVSCSPSDAHKPYIYHVIEIHANFNELYYVILFEGQYLMHHFEKQSRYQLNAKLDANTWIKLGLFQNSFQRFKFPKQMRSCSECTFIRCSECTKTVQKCASCGGKGIYHSKCNYCDADGYTSISTDITTRCSQCSGTGKSKTSCDQCNGRGTWLEYGDEFSADISHYCNGCNGDGRVMGKCWQCGGRGRRANHWGETVRISTRQCQKCNATKNIRTACNTCSGKGNITKTNCCVCYGKGYVSTNKGAKKKKQLIEWLDANNLRGAEGACLKAGISLYDLLIMDSLEINEFVSVHLHKKVKYYKERFIGAVESLQKEGLETEDDEDDEQKYDELDEENVDEQKVDNKIKMAMSKTEARKRLDTWLDTNNLSLIKWLDTNNLSRAREECLKSGISFPDLIMMHYMNPNKTNEFVSIHLPKKERNFKLRFIGAVASLQMAFAKSARRDLLSERNKKNDELIKWLNEECLKSEISVRELAMMNPLEINEFISIHLHDKETDFKSRFIGAVESLRKEHVVMKNVIGASIEVIRP